MSATYSVTIDFGTGPEEISQFVQNINRRESLYNDLEPVADTVTMQIVFNQDLAQKLLEAVDAPIVITKNASAFFKGVVLPLGSIAITGDGYGTVGSFLTIEARDNGYRLDRIHGWNGQDSIFFNAMEISKPSEPTNSVIHKILNEAGYTAGEIGTLPTITKTITDTLRTEKEGTDATKIRPAFSGTSGVPYSDFLSRLCREIGYTYRFDLDGKFQMYQWAVDPSGVSPVGTLNRTNLMNYTLGRVDKDVDRFDVSYQAIEETTAKWSVILGKRLWINNTQFGFSGTLNRSQYVNPPISTSATFSPVVHINGVGSINGVGYANRIDFRRGGFIVNTQAYINIFSVNPETLEYFIEVKMDQGLAVREYTLSMDVYNTYEYFQGIEYKTASTGSQLKPQKIDTRYIDLEADASTYAQRLLEYTEGSRWEIDFETGAVLALGGYYTLDSTNEVGFSNVVRIISREVTEENSVTNEYRWRYKAHFIGDIVFTEPAGNLGTPIQILNPSVDPTFEQGIGDAIRITDEATEYIGGNFMSYDMATKTLRVEGDMILSGDSTVQGKIKSGEGLESINYSAGTTGWKIDGDGNAEFNNITVRGTVESTSGNIGGWLMAAGLLRSGLSGTARIELQQALRRISIIDSGNLTRVAMGYLEGLAKNDGTGNFGPSDYGFWAKSGESLKIDGTIEQTEGDFILASDAIISQGTTSGFQLGNLLGEYMLKVFGSSLETLVKNALINMTPRTDPASPANGDIWVTTAGVKNRIGGVTRTMFDSGNDGAGSGLDADFVLSKGIGTTGIAVPGGNFNNANFNAIFSDGAGVASNSPFPTAGCTVIFMGQATTFGAQIATNTIGELKVRGVVGGTWLSWHTVWSSGNDGAGSGLDADLLDGLNTASAATANTVMIRDASGRAKVATPSANDDVANKGYVDGLNTWEEVVQNITASNTIVNVGAMGVGEVRQFIGKFTNTTAGSLSTPAVLVNTPVVGSDFTIELIHHFNETATSFTHRNIFGLSSNQNIQGPGTMSAGQVWVLTAKIRRKA